MKNGYQERTEDKEDNDKLQTRYPLSSSGISGVDAYSEAGNMNYVLGYERWDP